jgi:serine/threonine protein kinase
MFHHPNLLTLEDVCSSSSTRGEASEVFLLFDFFPQSLQDLVNKHRCVWTSYLRVRRCRLFVCMFMCMCGCRARLTRGPRPCVHLRVWRCVCTCVYRATSSSLPEDVCLRIFAGVCNGIRAMHRHEPPIAHRDIKPGNVLMSTDGIPVVMVSFVDA